MKDLGNVTGDEKGSYRARLHTTGRDAAFDLVVDAPTGQHLVQFWKESASPPNIISSPVDNIIEIPSDCTCPLHPV
ncbi:hypothetical protein [Arthrobacter sp. ISL-95]|uniref:hypothetical protein n=1 Tax=Arthrobacter sp. ISL-95 TaxID=2819116 RepID=UPI001BEAFF8B|nr:hypothetical protein [Arthrobacter sp. ISL-95]MBT2588334.1 hypothetical protein [Arthrobacter sp. ISL-95]